LAGEKQKTSFFMLRPSNQRPDKRLVAGCWGALASDIRKNMKKQGGEI
jgi:hypothetical protein